MDVRSFNEFIGHKEIIKNLQNTIRYDKVSHAYLFTGETGRGKKLMASIFAAALQCRDNQPGIENPVAENPEPCQVCPSCRKAFSHSHPDIIFVTHEKPGVITVDEIREQVVETSVIKPYESRYKIYIIEDADKMNPQAQNAILKTIEEPPEYVVIILLASNKDAMLQTILSRCIIMPFGELLDDDVKDYLVKELHVTEEEAGVITAFAQGNIGRAKSVALSEEFAEKVNATVRFISNIEKKTLEECVEEAVRIAKDKANINEQLVIYDMWYRDVLIYKAAVDLDQLIFRQYRDRIREISKKISYEGLSVIFEAIESAKKRIAANVSSELVLELLFITIREN